MSDIFLISDTHFNHGNIIKYCDRPFATSSEMDWAMVEKWNEVVRPQDHVWHLGDVYFKASKGYIENILGSLNGKKRLVLGNHDNGQDQILHRHFEKIVLWRDFRDHGLLASHVPLHPNSVISGRTNIHGHIHNKKPEPGNICVSVEWTDYKPVHIEEVRDLIRKYK